MKFLLVPIPWCLWQMWHKIKMVGDVIASPANVFLSFRTRSGIHGKMFVSALDGRNKPDHDNTPKTETICRERIPEIFNWLCYTMLLGFFYPALAQNSYRDETEKPSVYLSSGLFDIDFGTVDLLDGMPNQASGTFEVISSPKMTYDVWISVPEANLDPAHQVYLAKNGKFSLPLNVNLTGEVVNIDPAESQASNGNWMRPHGGDPAGGDNVRGSSLADIYRVTLTENINLHQVYSEIPQGQYQLNLTVHVAMN